MGCGSKVKKTVKKAVSQTSSELSRTSDTLSKVGSSVAGAVQDPGAWTAYLGNPNLGLAVGSQAAVDNYETLNKAEKDAARAEAEKRMALAEEKKAMAAQEKMASDKAKAAADQAKERAARLGKGRRGLLYQGKETGVTDKSTVLGG